MRNQILFTGIAILVLTLICIKTSASVIFTLPVDTEAVNHSPLSGKDQIRIAQMKRFISITSRAYRKSSGHQLNLLEKFSLKLSQHRIKKMLRHYSYGEEPSTLSKISWLLKGLILGPIALVLGYLFLKDDERELIRWIWYGFAGFTIIVVALLLTL